jgi:hypothetical protein
MLDVFRRKARGVSSLEKDASRYRFIRDELRKAIDCNPHVAGIQLSPPGKKYWFDCEQDIDDAIDAAMKIREEKG